MYSSARTVAGAGDFSPLHQGFTEEILPPRAGTSIRDFSGQSSTCHTPRRAVRSDREQVFSATTTEVTNGDDVTMDAPSTPQTQLFGAARPSWMCGPRRPCPNNPIEPPPRNSNHSSLVPTQPRGPMANPPTAGRWSDSAVAGARNFNSRFPLKPPEPNDSWVPVARTKRPSNPNWFMRRIIALRAEIPQNGTAVQKRVEEKMTEMAGSRPKLLTAKEQTKRRHVLTLMEHIPLDRPPPPLTPSNYVKQLNGLKVIKAVVKFAETRGEPFNWPPPHKHIHAHSQGTKQRDAHGTTDSRNCVLNIPAFTGKSRAQLTTFRDINISLENSKAARKRENWALFYTERSENTYCMELLLLLWEEQENEMKNTRNLPLPRAPTQPMARSPALLDPSQQQPLQISDSGSENGAKKRKPSESAAEGHGGAVREDGSSRPEGRFLSQPVTPTPATPVVDDVGMAGTIRRPELRDTSNQPGGSELGGNSENASFQISVNVDAEMIQLQAGDGAHHSAFTGISGGEPQSQPAPVTSRPSLLQRQQTCDQSTPQQPEASPIPENQVHIPLSQPSEAPLLFSRPPHKENNMSERIQSTFRTVRKQKPPRKQKHAPNTLYREDVHVLHMHLRPSRVEKAKSKSKSKSKLQSRSHAPETIRPTFIHDSSRNHAKIGKSGKSKEQPIAKHTNSNTSNRMNSGGQSQQLQQQQQEIRQEPPRFPRDAPRSNPPTSLSPSGRLWRC